MMAERSEIDLLLSGGTVVTIDPERRIVAIGTARDLLVNVMFPATVLVDEEREFDVYGRKLRVFVTPDGRRVVAVTGPYIHPEDHLSVTVGLHVPYDLYKFEMDVSVSMADEQSVSASFPVGVVISLTGGSSTS